jgi:DNA-binding transcriptional MerR regulator
LATYSIRDLEKLSGIKAHTIRIWEQRYGIIEPKRTPTNIRYYDDDDLQYLLNIAFLNRNGMRISKIAKLSAQETAEKVASLAKQSEDNSDHLQSLTMAMIELSEEKFDALVNPMIEKDGFDHTVIYLLVPFLEKLSLLWLTGSISVVHEQFIHQLVRQKIAGQVDRLGPIPINPQHPKAILYEPEGEHQEVLLLLYQYFLRTKGCRTLFLGSSIPINELEVAINLFEPDCMFTTISDHNNKLDPQSYFDKLHEFHADLQIFATTQSIVHPIQAPANLTLFEDFNEFVEFLDDLG